MTFWIILVLAGWVSYLSLRSKNMLLALGASIMWLALLAYNLNFPPTNIVQGDTIHEFLTLGFIAIAIAVLLAWFRNRGTTVSQGRISEGDGEILTRSSTQTGVTPNQSLMSMSPEEYRRHIRSGMGKRRR